jgi:hypothetical protein
MSFLSASPHGDAFLDLQSHWVQLLDVVSVAEDEGFGRIEATRDDVLRKPCGFSRTGTLTQPVLGRKSRRNTPTNTHWLVVLEKNICHWSSQPPIPSMVVLVVETTTQHDGCREKRLARDGHLWHSPMQGVWTRQWSSLSSGLQVACQFCVWQSQCHTPFGDDYM